MARNRSIRVRWPRRLSHLLVLTRLLLILFDWGLNSELEVFGLRIYCSWLSIDFGIFLSPEAV